MLLASPFLPFNTTSLGIFPKVVTTSFILVTALYPPLSLVQAPLLHCVAFTHTLGLPLQSHPSLLKTQLFFLWAIPLIPTQKTIQLLEGHILFDTTTYELFCIFTYAYLVITYY